MTLQLRPTFSESWYRVANLKARLRAGAQISRQFYRDERWYVVRDPAGNQYHRLSDAAYRFVGLLDGTRTVEQAWESVGGTLEDDAPTQPEVIQILSHLYSANLIDADVTPDATVLLRRHKQLSKRKMQNRLMNVLFPRIPLWDPDKFLKRWMPLAKIAFSKFGALVWLAVVISAVVMLVPFWHSGPHGLIDAAKHSVDVHDNPVNVVYLWGVFVFIKLVHELGHAFSCRRFGGECHELGIMFLVFIPTPYVDASSAWSFRNKWHRIFVGAAGMIVELFFASLCAFVWINTGDTHSLVGQLSFNAMLVASFTTVIFNANPLLRYDGYYILSDFLEIPNLRQKSTEYSMGLLKRHVFGVKLQQPLPPVLQRFWLFFYAVSSSIYRTFVGVVIILLVAYQIPILGILMAIGGVITWLTVPAFKVFKYLAIDPELHRKRTRATIFTLVVTGAAVVIIGFIPFWMNVDEVAAAEAWHHESVRPERAGFVRNCNILVHDHDRVKGTVRDATGKILRQGDIILILEDPELEMEVKKARADLDRYKAELEKAQAAAQHDVTVNVANAVAEVDLYKQKLDNLLEKKDELTVRAPIDGVLNAPKLQRLNPEQLKRGEDQEIAMYVRQGDELGTILDTSKLNLRVLLEQKESEIIIRPDSANPKGDIAKLDTEIRLISRITDGQGFSSGPVLKGGPPLLRPAATDESPGTSVTQRSGEETQVNPQHPEKLMSDEFEIDVPVDNPGGQFVPGQKAWVRFKLGKQPLYWQWYRKLLQLMQTKQPNPLV